MIPERRTEIERSSQELAKSAASAASAQGLLASFAEAQFRWLFASNTTFFLAMGGQQVLRAWLVFEITGRPVALGLVSIAVAIPMLLIAPVGGVIADRIDRRTVVASGQAFVIASELTILVLLMTGRIQFWHLLVSAGMMGSVFPFIMPARQAIIANAVGRSRMTNAMALNMAAVNTTRVVGPAAAGFLIGSVGLNFAYGLNVALFFVALLALGGVRPAPPRGISPRVSGIRNFTDGLRYLARDRLVLVLLFFGLAPMFLVMPFQNLLVLFAQDVWHVGAQGFGMLGAVAGMGGLVGAVLVAWRSGATSRLRPMMLAVFGFGIFLVSFALSPWFLLALPLVFVANVFANLYITLNNTAIQVLIPDEVRGRVSSFLMMSFSLPLFGTLPVSALAAVAGAPTAIASASVLAVLVAVAFYLFSRPLRSMDVRLSEALGRESAC